MMYSWHKHLSVLNNAHYILVHWVSSHLTHTDAFYLLIRNIGAVLVSTLFSTTKRWNSRGAVPYLGTKKKKKQHSSNSHHLNYWLLCKSALLHIFLFPKGTLNSAAHLSLPGQSLFFPNEEMMALSSLNSLSNNFITLLPA